MDWLLTFENVSIWRNQPSLLISHCLYTFGALVTLLHAFSRGRSWVTLWIVIIINGYLIEMFSLYPDISNFWHSQGVVMLFGKRLPLPILFLYPCMYYTSAVAAYQLQLQRYYNAVAVGVFVILINFPVDFVGLKYLHWTFHDSDPNFQDRIYSVPWNSFTFHFIFPAIIIFIYNSPDISIAHTTRNRYLLKRSMITILFSAPAALIITGFLCNVFQDIFRIRAQFIFLGIYSTVCTPLFVQLLNFQKPQTKRSVGKTLPLQLYLIFHYLFFIITAIVVDPEEQISIGLHQTIGDCNATDNIPTLTGTVLQRKKYLCWENHQQTYFDFRCVPNFHPEQNELISWYTICGTAHKNFNEFVFMLLGITITAFITFKTIFRGNFARKHDDRN